jgi:serine/threonine kinase PknH
MMPKTLCQGRYRVQQQLGGGQHSTVYQCYDTERDERVAVKVLSVASPHPDIVREMFRREVGALEGFEHLHVVPMLRHEAEEEQGRLNIVLELVPGGQTLEHLIAGTGDAMPIASSMRWRLEQLLGLLGVLDKAHARGIIHRDVKMSNVLHRPRHRCSGLRAHPCPQAVRRRLPSRVAGRG